MATQTQPLATRSGSGRSTQTETRRATEEAVRMALRPLAGAPPSFGLLFVAPRHDLAAALAAARGCAPGATFVGCTTAGEITERGLTRDGVAALVVSSPDTALLLRTASGVKADPVAAGRALGDGFAAASKAAAGRGLSASTTLLLADGLNGAGEELVNQVLSATRPFQQVVGGAAGDDGAFKATTVGGGDKAHHDGAAALHTFSRTPWGVGVDHGLKATTRPMRVTGATRNVVHELDGRPAFDVYREYAAMKGVSLEPATAGPFLIANEIGILVFDEIKRARAPLSVTGDGSLACAADIPEGAYVAILDGEADSMISAAHRAAEEAHRNLKGAPASAVLLFDCVCRGMILDGGFGREIDAVRSVFPDVPVAGLLTYGEIARFKGRLEGWHNTTAVVVAIPA
jgi:methyl-accepting chemotaxis protein